MSERFRGVLVIAILALVLVVGYTFWLKPFIGEQRQVEHVRTERSTWSLSMQAYYTKGPIGEETYRISNDDGKVQMFYSATSRDGLLIKQFNVPLVGPAGTFLFEELRADGIWELEDKPLRPKPKTEYIIQVSQTLGSQGGSRAFGFSDPDYWATTKAREFRLTLPKGHRPINSTAITSVSNGRPLRDDRYAKIVLAIREFGPQSVQQAEAKIRDEIAASKARSKR